MRAIKIGLFALTCLAWLGLAALALVWPGSYLVAGEWREAVVVDTPYDKTVCAWTYCAEGSSAEHVSVEYEALSGEQHRVSVLAAGVKDGKTQVLLSPFMDFPISSRAEAYVGLGIGLFVLYCATKALAAIGEELLW